MREQDLLVEDYHSSLEQVGSASFSANNFSHNSKHNGRSNFSFHKPLSEEITLGEWLQQGHSQEELQNFFVNMDLAMKYIHNHGYWISSFAISDISILNHSIRQVKFHKMIQLPFDINSQRDILKNNILMSAILQIGAYANCLQYFRNETIPFLKNHFNDFSIFLPESDVPYYKGVIERGASVYLSEYAGERKKRDLIALDQQISSDGGKNSGKSLVKSNGTNYTAEDLVPPNPDNEWIYEKLVNKKEAAFARTLIYPILIILLGIFILLLAYLSV